MLTLYLVCLVLGGVLIGLSIFGGGDSDVDVTADADVDLESGEIDAESGGEGVSAAARFLSMRNLVFFLAFFGLTGTLLNLLGAGALLTLLTSAGLGAVAAVVVQRLMDYLRSSQSGAVRSLNTLAGVEARVVVGLDGAKPGKVVVDGGDRTHQLVARIHEGAAVDHVEVGDTVVVVRIQDGIALVAEKTYLA